MPEVPDHIRLRRDVILTRFKSEVARLDLAPAALPEPLLVDELDELLDRVCRVMEGSSDGTGDVAKKHAEARWKSGIDVAALAREYGVLSSSIIDVLADDSVVLSPREQIALVDTLSEALSTSVGSYAHFRDEQYAAQYDALQATEAMRDALIMEAPIGVAFLDRDLRYRLINEQLARIDGLPRAAHVGRTPAEIPAELPSEASMRHARETLASEKQRRDVEVTCEVASDPGRSRIWSEHWYPVRTDGTVIGVGLIVEDVTERRRASSFRERLLAVVSHDLRNPLNAIVMSATLLLAKPDIGEPSMGLAQRVLKSAQRMMAIVDQLFDYVSIDQGGGLPLAKRTVDLGAVAHRVVEETMLAHPGEPGASLRTEGSLRGEWDEARIAQLLSNLIANAVQHGTGPATVIARGTDDEVHVEVCNAGEPIPPEKLDTIFEPFKERRTKHLGLGLFIAREIVRAHGGRIRVRSSAADGTVFSVELPRRVHA